MRERMFSLGSVQPAVSGEPGRRPAHKRAIHSSPPTVSWTSNLDCDGLTPLFSYHCDLFQENSRLIPALQSGVKPPQSKVNSGARQSFFPPGVGPRAARLPLLLYE